MRREYKGSWEETPRKKGRGLFEHYKKNLAHEAHVQLDPGHDDCLCVGHERGDEMVHHRMGGKYKTRGKCGGSGHGGLDNLDSSPRTQERLRYAKKIHFSIFPHEIPLRQGHGENIDDFCL